MRKKSMVAVVLAAGMLLSGCGVTMDITVNSTGKATLDANVYMSEAEYKEVEADPSYATDLSKLQKVTRNGKIYYMTPLFEETYVYSEQDKNAIYASCNTSKFEFLADNSSTNTTDNQLNEDMDSLEFSEVTAHFPKPVLKTNATIGADGKSITWHHPQNKRIYAALTQEALTNRKVTLKGAKNNRAYSKDVKVNISSKGVITSLKVDGKETPLNSFTLKGNKKHKVVVKLLSGVTKTYKITTDTVKPKTNVKNNAAYRGSVRITYKDKLSGVKSAKLDGKNIKSGKTVRSQGSHKLVVTDKAGNKTTVYFTVQ